MAHISNDYNNMTAGGAACSYTNLGHYNTPYSMGVAPVGKPVTGHYIVPQWSAISYDSLTGDSDSCSGYGTINSAYGKGAGRCKTTYTTSVCNATQGHLVPPHHL